MKFNGESGVQVRNPRSLADLAAYTALKFFINVPNLLRKRRQEENNQFVFYLGSKDVSSVHVIRLEGVFLVCLYTQIINVIG